MTHLKITPMGLKEVEEAAKSLAHLPLFAAYDLQKANLQTQWTRAIEQGDAIFSARLDKKLVGLVWFDRHGAFGRGAYLRLLVVDALHHGQGVGDALLATFESHCANSLGGLFLLTSDFNIGAQKFYTKHGYRQVGALPDFVVSGVTELLFWKSPAGTKTPI